MFWDIEANSSVAVGMDERITANSKPNECSSH
jgi:hypothetical protein